MLHDLIGRVADQQDRSAIVLELFQPREAFGLELGVADRQGFIDDQQLRMHLRLHRERQAHHHAAGIAADRLVDERTDVGEGENAIEAGIHLVLAQAQDRGIQIDVLAPGEFGIEAASQLQQCRHTPLHLDAALGRGQRAGDHLQERRFSRTVATDEADRLAAAHLQIGAAQGPEFAIVAARTAHQALQQTMRRPVVDVVALADATRIDHQIGVAGHRTTRLHGQGLRGHRRTPGASSGTRSSRNRRTPAHRACTSPGPPNPARAPRTPHRAPRR